MGSAAGFFHTRSPHGPVTDKPLNFVDLGKRMVIRRKKNHPLWERLPSIGFVLVAVGIFFILRQGK